MGCPGYCCAAFSITKTLDEIEDLYRAGRLHADDEVIASMLIPLTAEQATERLREFGSPTADLKRNEDRHWYTCIHWDEQTRLCSIYENRPRMCRDYPSYKKDGLCDHGCGLKQACSRSE